MKLFILFFILSLSPPSEWLAKIVHHARTVVKEVRISPYTQCTYTGQKLTLVLTLTYFHWGGGTYGARVGHLMPIYLPLQVDRGGTEVEYTLSFLSLKVHLVLSINQHTTNHNIFFIIIKLLYLLLLIYKLLGLLLLLLLKLYYIIIIIKKLGGYYYYY